MFTIFNVIRSKKYVIGLIVNLVIAYVSVSDMSLYALSLDQLAKDPKAAELFVYIDKSGPMFMDKFVEKIKEVCCTTEKLYLRSYIMDNKSTLEALRVIVEKSIDLSPLNIKLAIDDQPNSPKNILINELLEHPVFIMIKTNVILPLAKSLVSTNIDEKKLTANIRCQILANLNETEISGLIKLIKSPASVRIQNNVDEFIKLIRDNLTPKLAIELKKIFPWLENAQIVSI